MGAILASNFKMYRCTTWTEGDTHGGVINTSAEIASSGDQVIFDDVTDDQRISGIPGEYRKVFIRNENADSVNLKIWIEANYSATNESISIALGTDAGVQSVEGVGATYATPANIGTGLDIGALAQNASKAVWIKRVVTATGNGYVADTFQLKIGMY
jgi:hypothetical protein